MLRKNQENEIFKDKWCYGSFPKLDTLEVGINVENLVTMGSCFARNLTRWLNHYGYIHHEQPWDIFYNPFSILAEFRRIFEPFNWKNHVISEVDQNKHQKQYRDPWRTWCFAKNLEDLAKRNRKIDSVARLSVSKASAFLFTLGLSEVWSPHDNPRIILNRVPIEAIRLGPNRWANRNASFEEVKITLKELITIIRSHINDSCPIIFTLSPVPLKYTSSHHSIRTANNISKGTLLVAIHEACNMENKVFYYPSYEIVQALIEQGITVWQQDYRHVTASVVNTVANNFLGWSNNNAENIGSESSFWVPLVDTGGVVIGKLYVDGSTEVDG